MTRRRDEAIWFKSQAEWRAWLEDHHDTATECWVGCRKVHVEEGILVREALDEALCFGWIDSVRHGVDADGFAQRFTPRTSRSPWSEVNRKRMVELLRAGQVHPAGLRAWEQRDATPATTAVVNRTAELDPEDQARFEDAAEAYGWFQSQPPGYRRQALWWVMEAKRPETRARRLATLIDNSAHQRRLRHLT
jgi:uncharacterized protein YdeI (YjbR/CyaY-like superfamily)